MPYEIQYTPSADREFTKLPKHARSTLDEDISQLSANPRPANVKKIRGQRDLYRIRSGDFRVVYRIDDTTRIVTITNVGHRGGVYRHLSLILDLIP